MHKEYVEHSAEVENSASHLYLNVNCPVLYKWFNDKCLQLYSTGTGLRMYIILLSEVYTWVNISAVLEGN